MAGLSVLSASKTVLLNGILILKYSLPVCRVDGAVVVGQSLQNVLEMPTQFAAGSQERTGALEVVRECARALGMRCSCCP